MQKAKMILWTLIIVFIGLVILQNKEFFLEKHSFSIHLLVADYQIMELYNVVLFLACFITGLLISYFFSLSERFKTRKMIKGLNSAIDSHVEKISALRTELDSLKGSASKFEEGPADESQQKQTV